MINEKAIKAADFMWSTIVDARIFTSRPKIM